MWQMKTKRGLRVADEAKGGFCAADEAKRRLVCGR